MVEGERGLKAKLILCDAAVIHPDGTFSLLRGGIDLVTHSPGKPLIFRGALVARIEATPAEKGSHSLKLMCIDEDGNSILPEASGSFQIADKGGGYHLALNVQVVFPKVGRYDFRLSVDGHEMDVYTLTVLVQQKEPNKK